MPYALCFGTGPPFLWMTLCPFLRVLVNLCNQVIPAIFEFSNIEALQRALPSDPPRDRLWHREVPGEEIEHERNRENREDETGQDKLIRNRGVPPVALGVNGYRRDWRDSAF